MSVKTFLKKSPWIYHLLQKIYWRTRQAIETHLLGTKMQEWIWRTKHVTKSNTVDEYWKLVNHSHRKFLIDKISSHAPLESVLEIGCNIGPNLYLLSRKFAQARLYGIDINSQAIQEGKKQFEKLGITNVFLCNGKADQLQMFEDKSIDAVFADAVMMYIGPDKINSIINEIIRITRKVVVFNDWHMCNKNSREHIYYNGHWVYDYKLLLLGHVSRNNIHLTKIPRELWEESSWEKFGYIIEAVL